MPPCLELATPRLRLVPPTPGEEPALADALNSSLDAFRPWLPFAQRPSTVDELRAVVARARAEIAGGRYLQWRLWGADAGEMLGSVGVHRVDAAVPRGELGYWVRASATGRGLASEALHRVLEYLLVERGFRRVEARIDVRNVRSLRVVERLGFACEGVERNAERDVAGALASLAVYAICGPEELRRPGAERASR